MPTNEQIEDREDRAREHRAYVTHRFQNETFPEGMTPWDNGLMIVFVKGGSGDHGRIHRASCHSISKVANATVYRKGGGTYTVGTEGIRRQALRCQTCGTDTLPIGVQFWGDTDATVAEREAARVRAGRIKDFQRAMDSQIHAARNAAAAEVIAAHQEQVDALTATHLSRMQDEVRARFADVADLADADGE